MLDDENVAEFPTIQDLKNEIITLKLTQNDDDKLQKLLGAFTSFVNTIKEAMVIEKMNLMKIEASETISSKDESVKATVISDDWLDENKNVSYRKVQAVESVTDDELIDDWID